MFFSDIYGPRWVVMGMIVKIAQSVSPYFPFLSLGCLFFILGSLGCVSLFGALGSNSELISMLRSR